MKTACANLLAAALVLGGAPALAQLVVPVPPGLVPQLQPGAPPPAQWTWAQLRLAFDSADGDGDQMLSRAEAQQLPLMPRSFEDMDANKDGLLSRAEYEAAAVQAANS